jgi:hypothetical protein
MKPATGVRLSANPVGTSLRTIMALRTSERLKSLVADELIDDSVEE